VSAPTQSSFVDAGPSFDAGVTCAGATAGVAADCSARGPGVDLHGCNLYGVDLTSTNLAGANLSGAPTWTARA
jgi:uncharacterized protein YjbI with pentapeptide repeats